LFLSRAKKERGEMKKERKRRRRKETKEEKRTLQLPCKGPLKTGGPHASMQRRPIQEDQLTEAPNSTRKQEEERRQRKQARETKKEQEGGRKREHPYSPTLRREWPKPLQGQLECNAMASHMDLDSFSTT